jgi:hypothetical protein
MPVNAPYPPGDNKSSNFHQMPPPRSLIGAACGGFLLMWWGWWGLRTGRNGSGWYLCIFLLGCILWMYSVNGWINWKLPIHTITPSHTTNCTPLNP